MTEHVTLLLYSLLTTEIVILQTCVLIVNLFFLGEMLKITLDLLRQQQQQCQRK